MFGVCAGALLLEWFVSLMVVVSLCMFTFGVVTICQGLVTNWGGLMTTRWFLGRCIYPGWMSPRLIANCRHV
jgi:hypothetical protein